MIKALAVVAHPDNHALWMVGTIQRMATEEWDWTLATMCVPKPEKRSYSQHCGSIFSAIPISMAFRNYQGGDPFFQDNREEMETRLADAVAGPTFDYVFIHNRDQLGEYWGKPLNHGEVCERVTVFAQESLLGARGHRLA